MNILDHLHLLAPLATRARAPLFLCLATALAPTALAQYQNACHINPPGEQFVPNAEADQLGRTWFYNERSGQLVAGNWLFRLANPSPTLGPSTTALEFTVGASERSRFREYSGQASASVALWFINVLTAELGATLTSGNSDQSLTMTLAARRCYPRHEVLPSTVPLSDWNPLALAILQLPPAARSLAWTAAGFGPYVAFAGDLSASIGLEVGMNSSSSFATRTGFFDFVASFGLLEGVAFNLDTHLAALLHAAATRDDLSVRVSGEGVQIPAQVVPGSSEVDTAGEATSWVNTHILPALGGAWKIDGLYLKPCAAFTPPGYPAVPTTPYAWNSQTLDPAAEAAERAIEGLVKIDHFRGPLGLRNFLDEFLLPQPFNPLPGQPVTYEAARNQSVQRVLDALRDLSEATKAYAKLPTPSLTTVNAIQAKTAALDSATQDLEQVLHGLANVSSDPAIPPLRVTITDSLGAPGNCAHWFYWPGRIRIENGFFSDNSIRAIEAGLNANYGGAYHPVRVFVNPDNSAAPVHLVSTKDFRVLGNPTVRTSGPDQFLTDVRLQFYEGRSGCTVNHRVIVIDELGRTADVTRYGPIGFPWIL